MQKQVSRTQSKIKGHDRPLTCEAMLGKGRCALLFDVKSQQPAVRIASPRLTEGMTVLRATRQYGVYSLQVSYQV